MDTILGDVWDEVCPITIDNYPWNENGYKPLTQVKMFYTDTHFHLNFKSFENNIRATFLKSNDPVCQDSCVEFFFNPMPQSNDKYFNFEINPLGTILLGLGEERNNRKPIQEADRKLFDIKTSIETEVKQDRLYNIAWNITYSIPFTFIECYIGKTNYASGSKILGNFYKCGNDTLFPHHGCWNPIQTPAPDFHRPEYFGEIVLA